MPLLSVVNEILYNIIRDRKYLYSPLCFCVCSKVVLPVKEDVFIYIRVQHNSHAKRMQLLLESKL